MRCASFFYFCLLTSVVLCGCSQEVRSAGREDLWQADYDAALRQAAAEDKYLLVSISGIQWCHWCKVLESEVFSRPEFADYAKENLICILLDFNRSGRATRTEFAGPHERLLDRYQIAGFPTVLILDPQGRAIHRTGYQRGGPQAYIEMIRSVIAADRKNQGGGAATKD